eukprot:TRINITY_DN2344_c0_g1_i1.p1 TRINITY_DN2344_c0_g1~~TRINITY_DN2344_c0_g1_i1.p1  ORF type:complete len:165 (+),score=42.35 TRINITY_DN2344_c0_g1_i1:3-497(+)
MDELRVRYIRDLWPKSFEGRGFLSFMTSLELVEHNIKEGSVGYRLKIDDSLTNPMGAMHGGAISALLDEVTTMAVLLKDPDCRPGVSVSLEANYLSAIPVGSTIIARGKCIKAGRALAFVEGSIWIEGKDTQYVRFSQVKSLTGTPNIVSLHLNEEYEKIQAKL